MRVGNEGTTDSTKFCQGPANLKETVSEAKAFLALSRTTPTLFTPPQKNPIKKADTEHFNNKGGVEQKPHLTLSKRKLGNGM